MLVSKLCYSRALAGVFLVGLTLLPALAEQKPGMPDLAQDEQTCLPTSTANLIIWFGRHGYPKLIMPGATEDERELHTLHAIMTDTNARYDLGTRTDAITGGIEKYIRDAGYSCDVEYRGLDWGMVKFPQIVKDYDGEKYRDFYKKPAPFTQDWLQQNSDPNKGFLLLLAYCTFDRATNSFSDAIHSGHAVTLVSAEPDLLLIHDPAHWNDLGGRKIVTPELLTGGIFRLPGVNAPTDGLLLLSGSELEAPPGSVVMVTGAVCITMHPENQGGAVIASAAGAPNPTIAGSKDGAPAGPSPPVPPTVPGSAHSSWSAWVYHFFFGK
jgi:hypothetical protein